MPIGVSITDLKNTISFVLDIANNRKPFQLTLLYREVEGYKVPMFFVEVINKTKDLPLFIHSMRVSFGNEFYNHSLVLAPRETVQIKPKEKAEFFLPYENRLTMVKQTVKTRTKPKQLASNYPTFETPAALFKAIANGNKNDSWLEMDFNEFQGKQFCKGEIQPVFQGIIAFRQS